MELRSLRAHCHGGAPDSSKMMKYLEKKQEQKKAQSPCFPRQALPPTSARTSSPIALQPLLEAIDHIKVGCYYEIDHSKLPSRTTPEQLKSVRVVMVSEKGLLKVALRFPSVQSLHTHITEKGYQQPLGKQIPSLNEKYVMPPEMASEALYRRIPPQEIADRSNIWSFWAVRPAMASYQGSSSSSPVVSGEAMNSSVVSKKGPCWSELKFAGMVKWGKRRQVRYLRPHEPSPESSSGEETEKGREVIELEDGNNEEIDEEEMDDEKTITVTEEEEAPPPPVLPRKINLRKRKRQVQKNKITQKITKSRAAKRQKQNQIVAVPEQSNKKLVKAKHTVARWSAGRYKLAEENMLKVMKAKGAAIGNPILRPALRNEARKLIGDTGLLDHLLKHMAGKVAPGGADRFRRRHNADGAMEYWLESADLVNIRKEAGVQDPYWTPPPGWKLGDNPSQDPTCAREIKELRDEITQLKREMELKRSKKEEDLAIVNISNSCVTSLDWENDDSLLIHLKEVYAELKTKKAKIEEQLMEVSHSLSGMEEQIAMLSNMKEPPPISDIDQGENQKNKSATKSGGDEEEHEEDEILLGEGGGDKAKAADTATEITEDKAAKIERLRSGFRICRPQGSFLWPNMGVSPTQVMVPQLHTDPFAVPTPTPPSASSSSATTHHHLLLLPVPLQPQPPLDGPHPGSPVKPLAERRPATTTSLCNVTTLPSDPSPPICPPPQSPKSQTKTHNMINLNEFPNPQNSCGTGTLTYQRRQQNQNTVEAKKEEEEENENGRKDGSDYSPSTTSSTWMEEKCWLAVATPSSSLENTTQG